MMYARLSAATTAALSLGLLACAGTDSRHGGGFALKAGRGAEPTGLAQAPGGPNGLGQAPGGPDGLGQAARTPSGLGEASGDPVASAAPRDDPSGLGTAPGDTPAGGGSEMDFDGFTRRFAEVACQYYFTPCDPTEFSSESECVDEIVREYFGDFRARVGAGIIHFNREFAGGCLVCAEAVYDAQCREPDGIRCRSCDAVFSGTVPEGGACQSDLECASKDADCERNSDRDDEDDTGICTQSFEE